MRGLQNAFLLWLVNLAFLLLNSPPYFILGTTCQHADWPTHKKACKKSSAVWYDKHRKCRDGNKHEGRLELIIWSCPKEATGWGHCCKEESDDLRRKFEVEFGGDEEKFHEYWPQGFRWTCCGTDAGMEYGCDHHGSGSKPCTCDFCRFVFTATSRNTDVLTTMPGWGRRYLLKSIMRSQRHGWVSSLGVDQILAPTTWGLRRRRMRPVPQWVWKCDDIHLRNGALRGRTIIR
jgi:hypothetical protein